MTLKLSFLLVDDNPVDRLIAKKTLLQLSETFQVTEAGSGEEALEILQHADTFDIVLLDINMPVISGKDLLLKCLANANCRNQKFVMLSSSGIVKDMQDCLSLGAIHYIVKPLTYHSAQQLITFV